MIYFTGDINLTDNSFDVGCGVGSNIKKGFNPFMHVIKRSEDIWVGNFEGVCSEVTCIDDYKKDTFRISTELFSKLCEEKCIIDYWGVANNHVMEHGVDAYNEMCDTFNGRCCGCFGSLRQKCITFSHQNRNVSILGFSYRNDNIDFPAQYWRFPQREEIEKEIENIRNSDFKIAYIHWGVEYVDYPYYEQQEFAHWLIDAGFDLIIGMHPHVLQGVEKYKGKYIYYSLGNFVFNMSYDPCRYGIVVNVNLDTSEVNHDYYYIDNDFAPYQINENEVPVNYRIENISGKLKYKNNIESYVDCYKSGLKAYRRANYISILKNIYKSDLEFVFNILLDFIKRRIIK